MGQKLILKTISQKYQRSPLKKSFKKVGKKQPTTTVLPNNMIKSFAPSKGPIKQISHALKNWDLGDNTVPWGVILIYFGN